MVFALLFLSSICFSQHTSPHLDWPDEIASYSTMLYDVNEGGRNEFYESGRDGSAYTLEIDLGFQPFVSI